LQDTKDETNYDLEKGWVFVAEGNGREIEIDGSGEGGARHRTERDPLRSLFRGGDGVRRKKKNKKKKIKSRTTRRPKSIGGLL